jgi:hypothetical protein
MQASIYRCLEVSICRYLVNIDKHLYLYASIVSSDAFFQASCHHTVVPYLPAATRRIPPPSRTLHLPPPLACGPGHPNRHQAGGCARIRVGFSLPLLNTSLHRLEPLSAPFIVAGAHTYQAVAVLRKPSLRPALVRRQGGREGASADRAGPHSPEGEHPWAGRPGP